jgi:hypothetical protein
MYILQRQIGRLVAAKYLRTICEGRKLDWNILSCWLLIQAAERTRHVKNPEQRALSRFIEQGLRRLDQGEGLDKLYLQI